MQFTDPDHVYALCPDLRTSSHEVVSQKTPLYNCFAFAAGDRHNVWCPYRHPNNRGSRGYWPVDPPPADLRPDSFIAAFESLGFEVCSNPDYERGYSKIAFFVRHDGDVVHIALQPSDRNGRWKSKLGELEDIEHELHALGGDSYGRPQVFMKRQGSARQRRSSSRIAATPVGSRSLRQADAE